MPSKTLSKIRVLSESITNKIAAGEVIERPASIVKELVENSLDAGADRIEILVKHGGKSLIRVADNGSGMSAGDAELALQRHATSKIEKAEDLAHLVSFGFRGEALPSIAAVSRFTMQTRLPETLSGTELTVDGGRLMSAKDCSIAPGTIVEIRDLFFNTPARRKFLKQDSTELGHIQDIATCFALAHLNAGFSLRSGEKTLLDLAPTQDLYSRIRSLLGERWSTEILPLQNEMPHIKLSGMIGKPSMASGNRAQQFFFVNRRWVKAYSLSHALQAGYHGRLMQGQFPSAIIFLEVDPEYVDVNVHPTKQQVRLSHEALIKSLIQKTVEGALAKENDLAPSFKTSVSEKSIEKKEHDHWGQLSFEERTHAEALSLKISEPPNELQHLQPKAHEVFISFRNQLWITKILGQIHHTYLLAETREGYVIIDQHAAHERVMFEELLKNFGSSHPSRQKLLMEEVLELHLRQVEPMKKSLPFLNRLGFEVEIFGEKSFVIRAVPAIFQDGNPVEILKTYLEEKETGQIHTGLGKQKEDIAALVACKRRSVKAHDPLTTSAIQNLLESLARCDNPFNCPHGRPTFLKYSLLDLEKQFKRK